MSPCPPTARSSSRSAALERSCSPSKDAPVSPLAPSLWSNPAARVLPYVFMIQFSNGVIIASQIYLLRLIACRAHWSKQDPPQFPSADSELCQVRDVAALTSTIFASLAVVGAVLGLGLTSLVQRMADRLGRKTLLVALPLIDVVSMAVLVAGFASSKTNLSYALIFISNVLTSIAVKDLFIPTLVIADVASAEQRTSWFARLQGIGLGAGGSALVSSSLIARLVPSQPYLVYLVSATFQALAALWALFFIPETRVWSLQAEVEAVEAEEMESATLLRRLTTAMLSPFKPLELLWPTARDSSGRRSFNLLWLGLTALIAVVGTEFTLNAIVLYLQDKYRFTAAENGYVLAYLMGSRFGFLVLIFPVVLTWGRRAFHRWQLLHPVHRPAGLVEDGTIVVADQNERTPLLESTEVVHPGEVLVVEDPATLSNHFDVILLFGSLVLDSLGYVGVALSSSWQQVIGCFTLLSFGCGATAALRSTFLAAVEPAQASESQAALAIIMDLASILSPIVMGSLHSAFLKAGRGELLFVLASILCLVASTFLFFVRRK